MTAILPLICILTIHYAPFETKRDFEGIVQNCELRPFPISLFHISELDLVTKLGKKKVTLLSARHLERHLNDVLYFNSTEFSKYNSWYCPDMFRIAFNFFFIYIQKKPITMAHLISDISFIDKMAAILDLAAILDY